MLAKSQNHEVLCQPVLEHRKQLIQHIFNLTHANTDCGLHFGSLAENPKWFKNSLCKQNSGAKRQVTYRVQDWEVFGNLVKTLQPNSCCLVGGIEMIRGRRSWWWSTGWRTWLVWHVFWLFITSCAGRGRDWQETFFLSLFLFHPSVLKPDLHLGLIKLQSCCNLHPPGPGQVLVEMEFFLQFCQLLGGKIGSHSVGLTGISIFTSFTCKTGGKPC